MTEREYARIFADNLNRMLRERNLSQSEVAEAIGVLQQTFNKWCMGGTIPRMGKIEMLCRFFHCNKSDLLEDHESGHHKKKARRVPVYGRIAAGLPIEAVQDVDDWEEVPAEWSGDFLALRVQGDSMTPRICSGDVVIIRRQPTAEDGQIAACYVNGYDATLKRIQHAGDQIILMANNPAFPPQIYPAKDVTILGVVVELRAKF